MNTVDSQTSDDPRRTYVIYNLQPIPLYMRGALCIRLEPYDKLVMPLGRGNHT
jgi:hypothetical protein